MGVEDAAKARGKEPGNLVHLLLGSKTSMVRPRISGCALIMNVTLVPGTQICMAAVGQWVRFSFCTGYGMGGGTGVGVGGRQQLHGGLQE